MGIIYLVLLAIFYIALILVKKSDKEQNLVLWLNLNVLTILSYHIFITLIFYLIHLKSTLLNLSIITSILTLILIWKIIKEARDYFFASFSALVNLPGQFWV